MEKSYLLPRKDNSQSNFFGHDHAYRRKYDMFQETKKFGCKAQVKILEIDEFPEFKVRMRKSCTVMIRVKQNTLL